LQGDDRLREIETGVGKTLKVEEYANNSDFYMFCMFYVLSYDVMNE